MTNDGINVEVDFEREEITVTRTSKQHLWFTIGPTKRFYTYQNELLIQYVERRPDGSFHLVTANRDGFTDDRPITADEAKQYIADTVRNWVVFHGG